VILQLSLCWGKVLESLIVSATAHLFDSTPNNTVFVSEL
jgi:hypothetical protein